MVSASLVLRKGANGPVGGDRIALLEAINRDGSIAGGAKAVGLSYKRCLGRRPGPEQPL